MFKRFDHVAIVVADTEQALRHYRDALGLPFLFSEVLEHQGVRLTHLDMGAGHLQLVQPLTQEHPLQEYLRQHGEGLHHICFLVDCVPVALAALREHGMKAWNAALHRGPEGREAGFIDPQTARGVLIEITGEAASER